MLQVLIGCLAVGVIARGQQNPVPRRDSDSFIPTAITTAVTRGKDNRRPSSGLCRGQVRRRPPTCAPATDVSVGHGRRSSGSSVFACVGATANRNTGHPEDAYDRIWAGTTYDWPSVSNTTAIVTSTSNDAYKVPPEVLMTATQTQNVTDPLSLLWPSANSTNDWSIYFHFVELQMQMGQFRELTVYVQDNSVETVMLENLKPVTVASSLPPLLNAVEFFTVAQLPNTPTFLDDYSWQGDPCIPELYLWSGLNCSYDSSPRIVSLNLSSSGLKGLIATSISNLTAVVALDLSNNLLIGSVPDFLAQMPSLKVLNLSGNNLNGSVPQTLLKKKADGSLLLSLDGNPNLCQSDNCKTSNVQPKKKGVSIAPIIASVAAVLFLILLGALAVLWIIKRRQIQNVTTITTTTNSNGGSMGHQDLTMAVKSPVKMLSPSSKQGYQEFHTEAQLLMVVHHRNLVLLIGYCEEFENMALIYEFMSNGNVRNICQRLQIAIDAAQGLEYLHNGCKPPIVHRDLKTPNILLNENMQAKIADFGVSKAFVTEHDSHISTRPSGTPGYLDPEGYKGGSAPASAWKLVEAAVPCVAVTANERPNMNPACCRSRRNVRLFLGEVPNEPWDSVLLHPSRSLLMMWQLVWENAPRDGAYNVLQNLHVGL
ncbi:hypothetical protein NL676_006736 [Syzygium grande]|nr:hypothetical protein NL676_006736 [Syzygium grande]